MLTFIIANAIIPNADNLNVILQRVTRLILILLNFSFKVREGWDSVNGALVLNHANGNLEPFIIQSNNTNKFVVEFISDGSVVANGFRAYFAS